MRQIDSATPPGLTRGRHPARRGFTLVELLVVIGVISLLISILLPSISAAQRAAQRVACSANLRTIGQAYAQYTSESKGKYPRAFTDIGPNGPWGLPAPPLPGSSATIPPVGHPSGIASVVSQGYLRDARVLYCPSAERNRDNSTASTGNRNAAGIDNLKFWFECTKPKPPPLTPIPWHPGPGPGGMHQTGYAIWARWNDKFEYRNPPAERIRMNWFAEGLADGSGGGKYPDKILASDHMVRGAYEYEQWNGHQLKSSRRIVGTTPAPGFPSDPGGTVNFAGGNVLYNDGRVVWKHLTDTVFRMGSNENAGFDVFW